MKIVVPSDDGKTISHHFGRTKGFVIIELEKESNEIKNREYRTNTFTGHARGVERKHGEGHHRAIREGIGDCDVVIANSMGSGVYEDLKSAGMKIFITDELILKEPLICTLVVNSVITPYQPANIITTIKGNLIG